MPGWLLHQRGLLLVVVVVVVVLVVRLPSIARLHVHVHLVHAQDSRLHVTKQVYVNVLTGKEVGGVAHDLREVEVQHFSAAG